MKKEYTTGEMIDELCKNPKLVFTSVDDGWLGNIGVNKRGLIVWLKNYDSEEQVFECRVRHDEEFQFIQTVGQLWKIKPIKMTKKDIENKLGYEIEYID